LITQFLSISSLGYHSNKIAHTNFRKKAINILRVFESSKAKSRKVVEATRVTNTTEKPLEATPYKTYAQVLPKGPHLLSAIIVNFAGLKLFCQPTKIYK
jgi:hypothetical protein